MMEKSHAELEKHHYQSLSNRDYQLEGLMDCMREGLYNQLPCATIEEKTERPPEPEWDRSQWDVITQLQSQVNHLRDQMNKGKTKVSKGLYDSV